MSNIGDQHIAGPPLPVELSVFTTQEPIYVNQTINIDIKFKILCCLLAVGLCVFLGAAVLSQNR